MPKRLDHERSAAAQRNLVRHLTTGVECFEAVWRGVRTRHHAHPEYQLTLSIAGGGRFEYRAGRAQVPAGCFALFHPNQPHVLEVASRAPAWHLRVLHLPASLLERAGTPLFQPAPVRADAALSAAFQGVWEAVEQAASEPVVGVAVGALGALLAQLPGLEPERDRRSRVVQRCLAHLDKVLDRNVSASELAALVGGSPSQVRRLLVAATGLPPHALHLQRRIQQGKLLLARGLSAADVAHATGFSDQAHFTRHFSKLVGVSPARYAAR